MNWSTVFHRGARCVTDRTTYLILLVGIGAAALPMFLLWPLILESADGPALVALSILVAIWSWIVMTFTAGALSISAVELDGSRGLSPILRRTLGHLGSFLTVTIIVAALAALATLAVLVLALPGLAGTAFAPVQALLTPLVMLVGGFAMLALLVVLRLAFAAVAAGSMAGIPAIGHGWATLRGRPADVLLFLAADAALVVGLVGAVCVPLAIGAFGGLLFETSFLGIGTFLDVLEGGDDLEADLGTVGLILLVGLSSTMFTLLAGAVVSFQAGAAVGFHLCLAPATVARPDGPTVGPPIFNFCDSCGTPVEGRVRHCDHCGVALALA